MEEAWNSIKCPFCFKTFAHDEVHFRIAETTCANATNMFNAAAAGEEKEKYKKLARREKLDPKYGEVWGNQRGGNPAKSVKDLFYVPWVDENNKKELIVGDYITDEDGFVEKIEVKRGRFQDPSSTRICPYCHNKLPAHYGKHPQKFISVLGVSASGKTVFIKQLLSKINDDTRGIASCVGGSRIGLTLPEDDNFTLTLNQPLPDSTRDLNFKVPYFVTMSFDRGGMHNIYDFVIYDIAGEILVNADPEKLRFFAGYIEESDAIITLIDPMQLIDNPRPEYPASQMITTLYNVFGREVEAPTAITISKSDLLISDPLIRKKLNPDETYFNANSIITRNIPWDPSMQFFYSDEYAQLNGQLRRFFRGVANPFYENVCQQMQNPSFFAVSALYDGVDQVLTFELSSKREWKTEHIKSYIEKFSILKGKLEYIKDDLEEQEANPEENIIDVNNIIVSRSFVFDQSDDIVRKLDAILGRVSTLSNRTEIRDAVFEQFAPDESFHLISADKFGDEEITARDLIRYISFLNTEMEDCSFDIYMQGYPRSTGGLRSLRIEEPFFWILSELDIIDRGNRYPQDTPQSIFERLFRRG